MTYFFIFVTYTSFYYSEYFIHYLYPICYTGYDTDDVFEWSVTEHYSKIQIDVRPEKISVNNTVLWIRIWSNSKLFAGSGVGSGSGQPLSRMNLKQNFSDKIHNFSTKGTININNIFFSKKIFLKSLCCKKH
jgi:hypothetical protein